LGLGEQAAVERAHQEIVVLTKQERTALTIAFIGTKQQAGAFAGCALSVLAAGYPVPDICDNAWRIP
jgi:hypothetical protein